MRSDTGRTKKARRTWWLGSQKVSISKRVKGLNELLTNDEGYPGVSDGKESACNAGDPSSIPGSGRSSGVGYDNPPQYSCLENPVDKGGDAKSQTRLSG